MIAPALVPATQWIGDPLALEHGEDPDVRQAPDYTSAQGQSDSHPSSRQS